MSIAAPDHEPGYQSPAALDEHAGLLVSAQADIDPVILWSTFVPMLAGDATTPRLLLSQDGGRSYTRPARFDPRRPPNQPAAVRLYGPDARARCLALDLDNKPARGGREQVLTDTAAALRLFASAGMRAIVDESPSGGRHLYVPLATPRDLAELDPVLTALGRLLPTADPAPMRNVRYGCLRPPGGWHKSIRGSAGHQHLLTPLPAAVAIARDPAPEASWQRLLDQLCPTTPDLQADRPGPLSTTASGPERPAAPPARLGLTAALPARYEALATTGRLPGQTGHGYASPSEARAAVLASAIAHGWTFDDVTARLQAGRWPGLLTLLGPRRRTPTARDRALRRDWDATARWLATRDTAASAVGSSSSFVRQSLTSAQHPQRGELQVPTTSRSTTESAAIPAARSPAEYQYMRTWWTAVQLAHGRRWRGRKSLTALAVLAAAGAAAMKTGSRSIAFGTRSLALATGRDQTVVAELLRELRSEYDAFVVHAGVAAGPFADRYELRIPTEYGMTAAARPWPAGPLPQVDPVFGAGPRRGGESGAGLGLAAWWTWHQLGEGPLTVEELTQRNRLSRSATYVALDELADVGLARRGPAGWHRGPVSPTQAATRTGAFEAWHHRLDRIRQQRAAWHAYLAARAIPTRHLQVVPNPPTPATAEDTDPRGQHAGWNEDPSPPPEAPPDYDDGCETALELLIRTFGAVLIDPDETRVA